MKEPADRKMDKITLLTLDNEGLGERAAHIAVQHPDLSAEECVLRAREELWGKTEE